MWGRWSQQEFFRAHTVSLKSFKSLTNFMNKNGIFCEFSKFSKILQMQSVWEIFSIISWNNHFKELLGWYKPKSDLSELIWDSRYIPALALKAWVLYSQRHRTHRWTLELQLPIALAIKAIEFYERNHRAKCTAHKKHTLRVYTVRRSLSHKATCVGH